MDIASEVQLGKPVSSLATTVAKISSFCSIAGGAIQVALGAYVMSSKNPQLRDHKLHGGLGSEGALLIVQGVLTGGIGLAIGKSAESASRTRTFLEIEQKKRELDNLREHSK